MLQKRELLSLNGHRHPLDSFPLREAFDAARSQPFVSFDDWRACAWTRDVNNLTIDKRSVSTLRVWMHDRCIADRTINNTPTTGPVDASHELYEDDLGRLGLDIGPDGRCGGRCLAARGHSAAVCANLWPNRRADNGLRCSLAAKETKARRPRST